jgi:hypothetical protein
MCHNGTPVKHYLCANGTFFFGTHRPLDSAAQTGNFVRKS